LRQATGVAVGMGMTAACGAAGTAALAGARGLRSRWGSRGEMTPWERLDAETSDAAAVHGAPQPGFDAVPGGAATATAGASAGRRPAERAVGGEAAGSGAGAEGAGLGAPAAVAAILDGRAGGVESNPGRGRAATQGRTRAGQDREPGDEVPQVAEIDAPEVPAMLETGYGAPLPIPEPPPLDDEPTPDGEHAAPPTSFDPDTPE
jgi:hypothetical protein